LGKKTGRVSERLGRVGNVFENVVEEDHHEPPAGPKVVEGRFLKTNTLDGELRIKERVDPGQVTEAVVVKQAEETSVSGANIKDCRGSTSPSGPQHLRPVRTAIVPPECCERQTVESCVGEQRPRPARSFPPARLSTFVPFKRKVVVVLVVAS
jgi:hypothetical protein